MLILSVLVLIGIIKIGLNPETSNPGFEPESQAPQASRMSTTLIGQDVKYKIFCKEGFDSRFGRNEAISLSPVCEYEE